jgi:hypothetical protein
VQFLVRANPTTDENVYFGKLIGIAQHKFYGGYQSALHKLKISIFEVSWIQLPSASPKNEGGVSGVAVLYPEYTCMVDSLHVGYLSPMLAGFRVGENRKATLGSPA